MGTTVMPMESSDTAHVGDAELTVYVAPRS